MTEKRFILVEYVNKGLFIQDNANDETQYFQGSKASLEKVVDLLNSLNDENEQLKIRNKGKQAFIDKQDKIIKLLYNQCKDFKEILDDSNITYPIDERLNKYYEKGVKL